ncbi:hypothetical protein BDV28DRAFT_65974 [Aspergillus coremiiformis]|uniref:Uncharacterized protein n=1 Tax=Aspergillus coremiiformis TaxID=138285 RepID=A0A5N6ZB78_9EURO|nr:hypothetical protein BDV28DRAFT_65974 [Aspergillus coremiiformis]
MLAMRYYLRLRSRSIQSSRISENDYNRTVIPSSSALNIANYKQVTESIDSVKQRKRCLVEKATPWFRRTAPLKPISKGRLSRRKHDAKLGISLSLLICGDGSRYQYGDRSHTNGTRMMISMYWSAENHSSLTFSQMTHVKLTDGGLEAIECYSEALGPCRRCDEM